jgi:nicotinamide mononucleotide transporter
VSNPLSVDFTLFVILGYPMSCIEFAGTALYLCSVWLISRRSVLTWPVGMIAVALFMALFYQIRLYSDTLEQVYYLGASVYGWWYWSRSEPGTRTIAEVDFSGARSAAAWLIATLMLSAGLGVVMSRVHEWAPWLFPEAASYPYLDALTTVMSLVAMWLMARKHIESWIYWIVVDAVGIWLYFVKDVKFVSLLYVILLVLAIGGLADWMRARRTAGARLVRLAA